MRILGFGPSESEPSDNLSQIISEIDIAKSIQNSQVQGLYLSDKVVPTLTQAASQSSGQKQTELTFALVKVGNLQLDEAKVHIENAMKL